MTRSAPPDVYGKLREKNPDLTDEERAFLAEVLPPERDEKTGRFTRGRLAGPGGSAKVPWVCFRRVVRNYVERIGGDMEGVVEMLFEDAMRASHRGDIAATKLLLDKLCGKDAEQINVEVGTAKLTDVERAARLQAILDRAARRVITVEPATQRQLANPS